MVHLHEKKTKSKMVIPFADLDEILVFYAYLDFSNNDEILA